MTDWVFAQSDPSEELARLHQFSVKKHEDEGEVEFIITVREYVDRNIYHMRFYAQADKQTNQKSVPYTPVGWGETMVEALRECIEAIHRFPYQGEEFN
jgi:hypothetical protein